MNRILIICLVYSLHFLVPFYLGNCQDLDYFEKTYKVKLKGIKKQSEYADPDKYYFDIGMQLGIQKMVVELITERDGWSNKSSVAIHPILRRYYESDGLSSTGWIALIMRMTKLTKEGYPDVDSADRRYVIINDQKELVYYGDGKDPKPPVPLPEH